MCGLILSRSDDMLRSNLAWYSTMHFLEHTDNAASALERRDHICGRQRQLRIWTTACSTSTLTIEVCIPLVGRELFSAHGKV